MDLRNRFTDRTRHIFQVANREAERFNAKFVDSEHVLLALVSENQGVAAFILKNFELHPIKIALSVEQHLSPASHERITGRRPHSAAVKNLIEYAVEEANNLEHTYVGTEHLLIALLREHEGIAARVLIDLGLTADNVRRELLKVLGQHDEKTQPMPRSKKNSLDAAECEFLLALYRLAVNLYKPRIEQRTDIPLGEISVWDYAIMHEHVVENLRRRIGARKVGFIGSFFRERHLRRCARSIESAYSKRASQCAACYYRSAIYVSFDSGTPHEDTVPGTTVHELSHALWEKLAGQPLDEMQEEARRIGAVTMERFRQLMEGFATYADRVFFLDLYPPELRDAFRRRPLRPEGPHWMGFHRVVEIVEEYGPQIFLEIPKRWRDL